MDSIKRYTGRLIQGQFRSELQDWYRAEDVEALRARLVEVEAENTRIKSDNEILLRVQSWPDKQLQREAFLHEAKVRDLEATIEQLRNEVNARKDSPVTRLHNICAAIGDMQKDSPFSQEAWDMQDEQNRELQKQLTLARRELAGAYEEIARLRHKEVAGE